MSNAARVLMVTSHGRQELPYRREERLFEVLQKNGVPWSSVSIYVKTKDAPEPRLTACLDMRLEQLQAGEEILLYLNRNVNPFIFSLNAFHVVPTDDGEPEASEYFYQKYESSGTHVETFLKKLSTDESKEVVARRVRDVLTACVPPGSDIVVGVSGGGDSNALLYGLSQAVDLGVRVHPLIIKGLPEWDLGVFRAQKLCDNYDLELKIFEEEKLKELLGVDNSKAGSLAENFEREFKGDDFEFLATLLIRLSLCAYADEIGTSYICTGLNLEDIASEIFFRQFSGHKAVSVPERKIGNRTLIYPLWLCPKRLIDGCFPAFSRENYDARYPCFSLGRNFYYSLAYAIQSMYPGALEKIAIGTSKIASRDPVVYAFNEQLGFEVEREIPLPLLRRFNRMLGKSSTVSLVD